MLPVVNEIQNIRAIFLPPVQDEKGDWRVAVFMKNECIKMTYCLNREHAEQIRGGWLNMFWGWQLN